MNGDSQFTHRIMFRTTIKELKFKGYASLNFIAIINVKNTFHWIEIFTLDTKVGKNTDFFFHNHFEGVILTNV